MKRLTTLLGLAALAAPCFAAELPEAATELGCVNCHAQNERLVGPSWVEISSRYHAKRNDPAIVNQLVKSVSNGSQDTWGSIPMVANDPAGKKHSEIAAIVKYILSLPAEAPAGQRK